jgi:hypothetical protein
VVALNLAHRAIKGRTAAVAAVLRAYDELVALGGKSGGGGGGVYTYMCNLATSVVPVSNACCYVIAFRNATYTHQPTFM